MIISFAWTTLPLLTGDKTVTRRRWTKDYASRFHAGDLVDAYDRSPRAGGQKVATIRLTCDPYRERLADMPEEDLAAEGGLWESKEEFIELFGGSPEDEVTVIRFELVQVTDAGLDPLFDLAEGSRQIQIELETEQAWRERQQTYD